MNLNCDLPSEIWGLISKHDPESAAQLLKVNKTAHLGVKQFVLTIMQQDSDIDYISIFCQKLHESQLHDAILKKEGAVPFKTVKLKLDKEDGYVSLNKLTELTAHAHNLFFTSYDTNHLIFKINTKQLKIQKLSYVQNKSFTSKKQAKFFSNPLVYQSSVEKNTQFYFLTGSKYFLHHKSLGQFQLIEKLPFESKGYGDAIKILFQSRDEVFYLDNSLRIDPGSNSIRKNIYSYRNDQKFQNYEWINKPLTDENTRLMTDPFGLPKSSATQFGKMGALLTLGQQVMIYQLAPFKLINTLNVNKSYKIQLLNENILLIDDQDYLNINDGNSFRKSLSRKIYGDIKSNSLNAYYFSEIKTLDTKENNRFVLCILNLHQLTLRIFETSLQDPHLYLSDHRIVASSYTEGKKSFHIFDLEGVPMPILHKGKEYPSIQANGQFFQIENEILFFEQKGYVIGVDLEFGQRIFKHKTDSKNSALKVVDGNLVEVYVDKGYDTVIAKISSLK